MKNKKKNIIYLIIFIVLLFLVVGATYTWFKWRSSNNTNVRITINNTSDLVITFDGGSNVTGALEPTLTKEEGIVKNFSASTNGLDVPMNIWLKLNTLPDALKDSTFKWELYRDSVYLNGGSFNVSEITTRTSGNTTDYNLINNNIVGSTTANYTLYLWIDGNVNNNIDMASKSFDFDLYATVSSEDFNISYGSSAADYITSLYSGAAKTKVLHNNIEYSLAPSESLMNDRLASMATDINGGNIRYYGANPNNYVWLGDSYISTYTFNSNGSSIKRNVGDKKLWRIIGVFEGRLKLISNDPIGETNYTAFAWNISSDYINQWGESTYSDTGEVYIGADLMRLLNPGYEEKVVNNSLYWSKGTGTVFNGRGNSPTANVSFANTGLSSAEQNMIDSATWYLGAYNGNASYVDVQYAAERQSTILGRICTSGSYCNDSVVRTPTWDGKVGLMYPSDYGYATDLTTCSQTLYNYSNSANSYACKTNDWLFDSSMRQWVISPCADSGRANYVFRVTDYGILDSYGVDYSSSVRPAVYVKSGVNISGGNGSESNPYVLSY